jgi:CHAT domain-containing protein
VWVVQGSGITVLPLPGSDELAPLVKGHRETIDNALADPLAGGTTPGRRLYDAVIRPLEAALLEGESVVIAPDGALHQLNFETLPVGGRYLIERVNIQVAPSLALLRPQPGSRAQNRSVLLIGDAQAREPEFPSLKYAADEMSSVAAHFTAGAITAFKGEQAAPSAYRDAKPAEFGLIHFTAHATANAESPLDSAVILSGPEHEHKLYARDVAEQPLRADLVTVSACRSAGERAYSGEGLVGFAWAFLRAGASRVIAGLWDVDDRSTAQLMDRVYASIAGGASPADALRAAKLTFVRGGGAYAKPYYWAPFQLFTVTP